MGRDDFFLFFLRVLFFSLVFWLGLISPYSFELGFWVLGSTIVPFAWRYSRDLGVSISILSCYHWNGELSLHVVWLLWNMVPSRVKWFVLMLVARLYHDTQVW